MAKKAHKKTKDTIFFPQFPQFDHSHVVERHAPREAYLSPFLPAIPDLPRTIPIIGVSHPELRFVPSGVLIPRTAVQPIVQKLKQRGMIDPNDIEGTVNTLRETTNALLPYHLDPTMNPRAAERMNSRVFQHGEHMRPLIAAHRDVKAGSCLDWTALFTALGREAGLNVSIEGHPRFMPMNTGDALTDFMASTHVWPSVADKRAGRDIQLIDNYRPSLGVPESISRAQYMRSLALFNGPKFYGTYSEHKPKKGFLEYPESLQIRRPDVFPWQK